MFSETQKQVLMVCVFLAVLALAGTWYVQAMFIKQRVLNYEQQTKTLGEEMKTLEGKKKEYQALRERRAEIEAMSEQVRKVVQRLPSAPDESQFHFILNDIMRQVSAFPIRVEKLKSERREVYTEIPYRITCFVKYHNLGELFNLLEENRDRFMRVKQFTITNESIILKDRPSVQYATIEIAAYTFNRSRDVSLEAMRKEAARTTVAPPAPAERAPGKKRESRREKQESME